jgi:hypothetical protein
MHRLVEIASSQGNLPTHASNMIFDGLFSSVSNRFWLCSAHNIVISRPLCPRILGLASAYTLWGCCCLWVRVRCRTNGLGIYYSRGSDCLTHPPRDDAPKFKNRSGSWFAGLGQDSGPRNTRGGKMSPKVDSVSSLIFKSSSSFSVGHSGAMRSLRSGSTQHCEDTLDGVTRLHGLSRGTAG